MEDQGLVQKEQAITSKYRSFLAEVREAFNKHCDEIKEDALKKFNAIPEEDEEGRRKVLDDQKAELDKTLSELKHLLTQKGAEVRKQLEEIAQIRDQQSFDLDAALGEVEVAKEEHAA